MRLSHGPTPTTVQELIDLYLASTCSQVTPHTYRERQRVLCRFAATFGHLDLAEVRAWHLSLWLDQHPHWRSDWQRKRVGNYLKICWNWADKLELVPRNPFRGIRLPNGDPGQPITAAQFQALLRHARPEMRRVLIFLRWTGCRPAELRAMQWPQVDIARGLITLDRHKTSRKTRRPRIIYLHAVCRRLLEWKQRRRHAGSLWVFAGPRGEWNRYYIQEQFRKIRQRAGLPATVRMYGLRHLFGSQAVLRGLDLKTVAELMGHSTTRMTEYYLHLAGNHEHFQAALDQVFVSRSAATKVFPRL